MTNSFYLYNTYTSTYLSVDLASSGFDLRTGVSSDPLLTFTFTPIANTDYVKICTTPSSRCLDVYGDNAIAPHLANPGNFSGQQWTLIPASNGLFKLSNQYTGSGSFLDVYSDGVNAAFMSKDDFRGQYWKQVQVKLFAINNLESFICVGSRAKQKQ
jgi:hypothetical protein